MFSDPTVKLVPFFSGGFLAKLLDGLADATFCTVPFLCRIGFFSFGFALFLTVDFFSDLCDFLAFLTCSVAASCFFKGFFFPILSLFLPVYLKEIYQINTPVGY